MLFENVLLIPNSFNFCLNLSILIFFSCFISLECAKQPFVFEISFFQLMSKVVLSFLYIYKRMQLFCKSQKLLCGWQFHRHTCECLQVEKIIKFKTKQSKHSSNFQAETKLIRENHNFPSIMSTYSFFHLTNAWLQQIKNFWCIFRNFWRFLCFFLLIVLYIGSLTLIYPYVR